MRRIGIYFFCVVALGCVTSGILYRKSELKDEIRLEKTARDGIDYMEPEVSESSEEVMDVLEHAGMDDKFLLIEEDGYLVIYDRLSMTRYDETTILIRELPETLQERIAEGLYFADEEALYAFLENYSS